MDYQTRRQFLAVTAVAGGGMAGCLGSERSVSRSESASEGPSREIPDEQAATNPPTLFRRLDADQPPIRLADTETGEGESGADEGSRLRDHVRYPQTVLLDTASLAERLVDDAGGDSSDDTELASFVSETQFDTETLYLESRHIDQCFELSLCYITWQSNSIRTDYSRLLRAYDERCAADTSVFESRLFRLPVALTPDEIRGYGSSTRSGRCSRGPAVRLNRSTDRRLPATNSSSPNGSESR